MHFISKFQQLFLRNKNNAQIHMELEGAVNSKNNLEKEQSPMAHTSQFQNLLQ